MKEILQNLDGIRKDFLEKDNDYLVVIDGREGSGKSSLALQCAEYIDKKFVVDNIAYTGKDFLQILGRVKDGSAVIFDEAAEGLYSSESLSPMNIMISKALMIARAKRLFIVIVIPSFFVLNKYVKLFRLGLLFHIVDRGRVNVYSHHGAKITKLVVHGNKYFDYDCVRPVFNDDFTKYHGNLWEEYTNKKMSFINESLKKKIDKQSYSLNEAAKALEVSTTWVRSRINDGTIKPIATKSGQFKIKKDELDKLAITL